MTLDGWKAALVDSAHRYAAGDGAAFDLLARALHESQQATAQLRSKGYGVTGMGIGEMVAEVPDAEA